jgi:hypothetical protein
MLNAAACHTARTTMPTQASPGSARIDVARRSEPSASAIAGIENVNRYWNT